MAKPSLILASASKARAQLLAAAGWRFITSATGIDEPAPAPGESLRHYTLRIALLKARAAAAHHPKHIIVAADTALLLPGGVGKIAGKPVGTTPSAVKKNAEKILVALVGREHIIGTGVCVLACDQTGKQPCWRGFAAARVRLREMSQLEIRHYLRRVQPWHCAGAYALQAAGASIIAEIHGDPTTIIGLPVALTLRLLAKAGLRCQHAC